MKVSNIKVATAISVLAAGPALASTVELGSIEDSLLKDYLEIPTHAQALIGEPVSDQMSSDESPDLGLLLLAADD